MENKNWAKKRAIVLLLWFLVVIFIIIATFCGWYNYNVVYLSCITLTGIGIFYYSFHPRIYRIAVSILLILHTVLLALRFSGSWAIPNKSVSDGEIIVGCLTWLVTLYSFLCRQKTKGEKK